MDPILILILVLALLVLGGAALAVRRRGDHGSAVVPAETVDRPDHTAPTTQEAERTAS